MVFYKSPRIRRGMKYLARIILLCVTLSSVAFTSDVLLFAKFDNQKDAKDALVLFRKIIQQTGILCGLKIVHHQNMYSVLSRREVTDVEKKEIIKSIDLYLHGDDSDYLSTKTNLFSGFIELSVGHADNIYAHTEIETTKYGDQNIDNNTSQVSDSFSLNTALLSHSYTFDNNSWMWRSVVSAYSKKYKNYHDIDIFQIALQSGPSYRFDNIVLRTSLIGKKLWFGDDALMDTYGLSLGLSSEISTGEIFSAELLALKKRMLVYADRDYDSNHLEFKVKYGLSHDAKQSLVTSAAIVMERRVHGARTDVNYNAAALSGKYSFPLWENADLSTKAGVEFRNYIDKHPHLPEREDTKMQVEVTMHQKFTDTLSPQISYSHTENYSNINLYQYKDDKVVVGVKAKF